MNDDQKTLINIFGDIKAGDIVLFQEKTWNYSTGEFDYAEKPMMAVIVGIDIWDMAPAVYYTRLSQFECFKQDIPEIHSFGEWTDEWKILGHWHQVPSITEIKSALRNKI